MCCVFLSACSPRHLIIQSVGNELARQTSSAEDDLILAQEASAFYLKLSESVLRETPDNLQLAGAVAAGFTQYAFAFVSLEADRIESKDVRTAQKMRERAARLYRRGHRHAMNALELNQPGFYKALTSEDAAGWPRLEESRIGVAYWAAASWGGYISLSKDDPDALADLPLAIRLARLAWQQNPGYGEGALASLMGSFEIARPGGTRQQAIAYFDQAIAAGAGKNAGVLVAKAEGIALPAPDRVLFETLLREAIAISQTHKNLANEVMRERASWLLQNTDDLF